MKVHRQNKQTNVCTETNIKDKARGHMITAMFTINYYDKNQIPSNVT